ncbi:HK97 gp10 family phage protein [Proteus sp. PR00174]|uniref:HK97-gp10 family putative phage morphogenesis protein n=1 Tax=Proteus sp. PR00174 TaxID=2794024 RepID=UPI0018E46D58|nr:HK97-gp10 family putative phage morphogenesis protein [Proteus sp. PR00174]MBI6510603.1 HK97 gp10 family phage protein [Proteus sp. PR00174]
MNLDFSDLLDLSRELDVLSRAESHQAMRKATNAAATLLRDEIRTSAPRKTGKLARNIVTRNHRIRNKGEVSSGVYVRGSNASGTNSDTSMKSDHPNNAFYWRFLEEGTSKMAPRPFIRPTFDRESDNAANLAINELNRAIDEALGK